MNLYLEALDRIHAKKEQEKAPVKPKPADKTTQSDENFGDAGYFFKK